jgi:hypothetical protein
MSHKGHYGKLRCTTNECGTQAKVVVTEKWSSAASSGEAALATGAAGPPDRSGSRPVSRKFFKPGIPAQTFDMQDTLEMARKLVTEQIRKGTRRMIEAWIFECELRFGKEAADREREHFSKDLERCR